MALAYSLKERSIHGPIKRSVVEITLDALYVANGWALDLKQLGFLRSASSMAIQTHNALGYSFELTAGESPKLVAKQGAMVTGATAAGGTTGTFATDPAGAETVGRLQSAAVSTTVRCIRAVEAAASDAFLSGKVVRAELYGW